MKKVVLFSCTLFIITILLVGCNYNLNNISFKKTKPNNFYYTNILAKNFTLETSYKGTILDSNFYKEKELTKENMDIIKAMLKALNKSNFILKPKDLPSKPSYKMVLTFKKDKLVINVYNEKYLTIYPWDGDYPMDYIDMTNIPASLNLYSLSKYIFN
ncbi:DUF4883 family protein [Clostridium sp. DJ247]|uniref:DUF4883 family protein n=1 Tax=Clostridium sp. DJ247 TaxID=2726188 RepID=UPI001629F50D|nr:DUF4883 family protein [Clostridium sp. DJ247]